MNWSFISLTLNNIYIVIHKELSFSHILYNLYLTKNNDVEAMFAKHRDNDMDLYIHTT